MSSGIPDIFQGRVLREKVFYRNLSKHSLSNVEKTFIGLEAARLSSLMEWDSKPTSILSKACKRYQLPYSTVQDWVKKLRCGQPIVSTIGRPASMDKDASEKFISTLIDRRAAKNSVPLAEALTLLGQGVADTKKRQGKRVNHLCHHSVKAVQDVQCGLGKATNHHRCKVEGVPLPSIVLHLGLRVDGI